MLMCRETRVANESSHLRDAYSLTSSISPTFPILPINVCNRTKGDNNNRGKWSDGRRASVTAPHRPPQNSFKSDPKKMRAHWSIRGQIPVQHSRMKRCLWLLVGWFAMGGTGFGSGLIILHDEDFWREPPRFVPPLPHPHPLPPPRPFPEPAWQPMAPNFNQVDVQLKDPLTNTTTEQESYN